MVSTIETININADDFTDNFLTCPTCMGPYDETDHQVSFVILFIYKCNISISILFNNDQPKLLPCSHTLCRSCLQRIAASSVPANSIPNTSTNINNNVNINSGNSIARSVAAADAAVAAINNGNNNPSTSLAATNRLNNSIIYNNNEQCFRCPICRETIIIPRSGINALPPSFIVNQLLDLIKNQRRDLVPRCTNHPNEGIQTNKSFFV